MSVSVLILAFNEADNITQCIETLRWCDDIWMLDDGSTDGTVDMARNAGVNVVHQEWLGFAGARNFGVENLPMKHDWVLHLDADEAVSEELAQEILAIARDGAPDDVVAYETPFRIRFLGRWLRYGGTYPNCQVRFGRKDALRFVLSGHGQREHLLHGRLARHHGCIYHFSFSRGLGVWYRKHAGYAEAEALKLTSGKDENLPFVKGLSITTRIRRHLRRLAGKLPGRPLIRFVFMYFVQFGFLDGLAGLHYAILMSFHEHAIGLNVRELKLGRDKFDLSAIPPSSKSRQ